MKLLLIALLVPAVCGVIRSSLSDDNELFLQGNKIGLGVHSAGSFGTIGNAPEGFVTGVRPNMGMIADEDGFGTGVEGISGDFFLPGSPEERFAIGYNTGSGSTAYSNSGMNGVVDITMTGHEDLSTSTRAKGRVVGNVDNIQVEMVYSFGEDDLSFKTEVVLTNIGTTTKQGVRFMRSFDPDQDVDSGGSYTTDNTIVHNFPAGPTAVVEAVGMTSGVPIFFFSDDARSRVGAYGFFNPDPYDAQAYDAAPVEGYNIVADCAITIAFDVGDLVAGQSQSFWYITALALSEGETVMASCPSIPDGTGYSSSCTSRLTEDGGKCTLSCAPGYSGSADHVSSCADGAWDAISPPSCSRDLIKPGDCVRPESSGGHSSSPSRRFVRSSYTADWDTADAACIALGGHLASIHSEADNTEVFGQAAGSDVWIGYVDDGAGDFFWSDGSCPVFELWAPGQPGDFGSGSKVCTEMFGGSYSGAQWNDGPCSMERYFICEFITSSSTVTFNKDGELALRNPGSFKKVAGNQDRLHATELVNAANLATPVQTGKIVEEKIAFPEAISRAETSADEASTNPAYVAVALAVPVAAIALFAAVKVRSNKSTANYAAVPLEA